MTIEPKRDPQIESRLADINDATLAAIESVLREQVQYFELTAAAPDLPDHARQWRTGGMFAAKSVAETLYQRILAARKPAA